MNIKNIIIPWKNQKDLVDIPEHFRKKLNFIPVKSFEEVLEHALVGWKESKKVKKESGKFNKDKLPPMAA
jgi:ATP-dependent Lon protease